MGKKRHYTKKKPPPAQGSEIVSLLLNFFLLRSLGAYLLLETSLYIYKEDGVMLCNNTEYGIIII